MLYSLTRKGREALTRRRRSPQFPLYSTTRCRSSLLLVRAAVKATPERSDGALRLVPGWLNKLLRTLKTALPFFHHEVTSVFSSTPVVEFWEQRNPTNANCNLYQGIRVSCRTKTRCRSETFCTRNIITLYFILSIILFEQNSRRVASVILSIFAPATWRLSP